MHEPLTVPPPDRLPVEPGSMLRLNVDDAEAGWRLDRYVAGQAPGLSRSYARQLIETAYIRLNGREARPSALVRPGDVVTIERPLAQPTGLVPQPLPLTVVYEDSDVVVIDKPPGLVVHPAPGHPDGTLVNALLAAFPDIVIGGDLRPGIVHRLDRDTSGLLVVARNEHALRHLQAQQQARTMTKVYLVVVAGRFHEQEGVIDAPVGRHPTDRTRMAVVAHGRSARTCWRVVEELGDYTLVEARLETGRTHQIRVHFASRNRPVLGDPLYGPRRPHASFGLTRQFLHAHRLGFALPTSERPVLFESPLPEDLAGVLEKLRARLQKGKQRCDPK